MAQDLQNGGKASIHNNVMDDDFAYSSDFVSKRSHKRTELFNPTVGRRFREWLYQKRDLVLLKTWSARQHFHIHRLHYSWAIIGMLVSSLMFSLGVHYQQNRTIQRKHTMIDQHSAYVENMTIEEKVQYFKDLARWNLDRSKSTRK